MSSCSLSDFIDCTRNDSKILAEAFGGRVLSFPTIESQEDCPDQSDFINESLYRDIISDVQYLPMPQYEPPSVSEHCNLQLPCPLPTRQTLHISQRSGHFERTKDRTELAIIEEENTFKQSLDVETEGRQASRRYANVSHITSPKHSEMGQSLVVRDVNLSNFVEISQLHKAIDRSSCQQFKIKKLIRLKCQPDPQGYRIQPLTFRKNSEARNLNLTTQTSRDSFVSRRSRKSFLSPAHKDLQVTLRMTSFETSSSRQFISLTPNGKQSEMHREESKSKRGIRVYSSQKKKHDSISKGCCFFKKNTPLKNIDLSQMTSSRNYRRVSIHRLTPPAAQAKTNGTRSSNNSASSLRILHRA